MGVVWAFVAITPFMALVCSSPIFPICLRFCRVNHFFLKCILAALLLGNVNVTKERNAERNVFHGVYLLHILGRRQRNPRLDAEQVPGSETKAEATA